MENPKTNSYDQDTKTILLIQRVELEAKIQRDNQPIDVEELKSPDRVDRAKASEQFLTRNDGLRRNKEMLFDVNAALQRCEAGTYGICEDCHGQILRARLKDFPTAKRCVGCQSKSKKEPERQLIHAYRIGRS